MREISATPQGEATTETRAPGKARVIPIDANSEAMSLFSSEQKAVKAEANLAASPEASQTAPVPLLPPEQPAAPKNRAPRRRPRSHGRRAWRPSGVLASAKR